MITLPAAARICMRCNGLVVDDFEGMVRCLNCGWQGDRTTHIWTLVMNELEE